MRHKILKTCLQPSLKQKLTDTVNDSIKISTSEKEAKKIKIRNKKVLKTAICLPRFLTLLGCRGWKAKWKHISSCKNIFYFLSKLSATLFVPIISKTIFYFLFCYQDELICALIRSLAYSLLFLLVTYNIHWHHMLVYVRSLSSLI